MFIVIGYGLYLLSAPFIAAYLASRKGRSSLIWAVVCFFSPFPLGLLLYMSRLALTYRWLGLIPSLAPLAILIYLATRPDLAADEKPAPATMGLKAAKAGAGVLALGALFVAFRVASCCTPHTFLSSYPKAMLASRSGAADLTAHFPYSPESPAKLTKFHSNPGGFIGQHWVARFEGDAAFIADTRKTYAAKALPSPGAEYLWKSFATRVAGSYAKYDEYDLILLVDRPGNHARAAGIFLSKSGNDAIFFGGRL